MFLSRLLCPEHLPLLDKELFECSLLQKKETPRDSQLGSPSRHTWGGPPGAGIRRSQGVQVVEKHGFPPKIICGISI